jgi:hypothetical protein
MALKSKRSGFVYKPRTAEQVKGRATRKSGLYDSIFKQGFDTYRPKQGDNLIRYLPPTWDDSDHYGYTAFVHRNIGPDNATYLCPRKMLNKPCPICEAQKEAKDAGESEEATALNTAERIISWVIDRDADDPEKPLLYDTSWTQDRDIVSLCVNERSGEILMIDHPDKGYDVTIKRTGTGMRTKYYGYAISRDDCPIHDSEKVQDEILEYVKDNPVPDTLNFYDYDYLSGVLSGKVSAKDEALDRDEDDPAPKRTNKAKQDVQDDDDVPFDTKRRGPRRDQELDPESEMDEIRHPRGGTKKTRAVVEEEEDDDPPPRRSARKPEPVDEEVDEEADDTPPPRSSRTASRTATNGRSRVVEEESDEEDDTPPPRSERRSNTRVR